MEMTKVKLSALFIALIPLLGSPVIHAETTAAPVLENRAAQGDITTPGGARRLTGDQTEALRASLINKPAKNALSPPRCNWVRCVFCSALPMARCSRRCRPYC